MTNLTADQQSFYSRLEKLLANEQTWPSNYMFKFITKNNTKGIALIKDFFTPYKATYSVKQSARENYQSLTVMVKMPSVKSVIEIYQAVGRIKDIIQI